MDNFPTTLAAMGVKIEGNRLGLGTNLFSEELTLMEDIGESTLKAELKKKSEFLEKISGVNKKNERVLIRAGEKDGAHVEAKVVTGERIEVIVDEIVPEVQENMKGILLSVWQQEDQKDLQWIEPQKVGESQYEANIDLSMFDNRKGKYYINVLIREYSDVEYIIGSTECNVE